MARKKQKKSKQRNTYVVAMLKRHPRKQVHKHKCDRRAKDHKNSWKREWE